jgi:hypothetical protein
MLTSALLFAVALVVVALEAGDGLFVQVRETELRSAPGFLSMIVSRLEFGDELVYQDARSGFVQVVLADGETVGWIHEGAIKENRSTNLQLQGESTTRTVTSREIALAGRGFSETLEDEYGDDRELDFTAVDALEGVSVDPTDLIDFIQAAGLRIDFLNGGEE